MKPALVFVVALGALSLGSLSLTGCDDGGSGGSGGTGASGGSGGSGASGGSGGAPNIDDACASFAAALCEHVETCAPFVFGVTYGDQATCQERLGVRCKEPTTLDGANIVAADIEACTDAYAARSCEDVFAGPPAICRVAGDKANGATCSAAAQCLGSLCERPAEGECGECATILNEGDPCAAAPERCDDGLFCNASDVCEAYAASGAACSAEKPCKAGLSCDAGTCGALEPEGADCSLGQVCDITVGGFCSLDGNCHTFLVAALGQACGFDQGTGDFTLCEADAFCAETEVCTARPKEGQACTVDPETGNGDCITGLDCVGGKCQAALPVCN